MRLGLVSNETPSTQLGWLRWKLEELVRANQWERASSIADQILDLIKEKPPCPGP